MVKNNEIDEQLILLEVLFIASNNLVSYILHSFHAE
jgi:hypothetical protein